MTSRLKQILKYVISIAIAAGLLYFSFRGVDWGEFAKGIKDCNWAIILLSMSCGAIAFALRGLRWRLLLKPLEPSIRIMSPINAINIGNLTNMAVPYIGEFVRCGFVAKGAKRDIPYDKTLGTIALERVWDLFSLGIIFLIILLFGWDSFGSFFIDKIWAPLCSVSAVKRYILAFAVLLLVAASIAGVIFLKDKNPVFGKIYNFLNGLKEGFMSWLKMKEKVSFLLLTILVWAMYWLQMVLLSRALPCISGMSLMDSLFLMLAGSVASVVPVPGGFGAYHYLMASALSAIFGYSWAIGILYATIAHESQAITMIITGIASYFAETLRKKNKL